MIPPTQTTLILFLFLADVSTFQVEPKIGTPDSFLTSQWTERGNEGAKKEKSHIESLMWLASALIDKLNLHV